MVNFIILISQEIAAMINILTDRHILIQFCNSVMGMFILHEFSGKFLACEAQVSSNFDAVK